MRRYHYILAICLSAFLLINCKEAPKTPTAEGEETLTAPASTYALGTWGLIHNQDQNVTSNDVLQQRVQANAIIEHRWKENNKKSWAILTSKKWDYKFVYDGDGMNNEEKLGKNWIQFYDDLTYKYGTDDKTLGDGRYDYDADTELLVILSNDKRYKPNEFKVNLAGESLVLIGQATYKDNNYQAKLEGTPVAYGK